MKNKIIIVSSILLLLSACASTGDPRRPAIPDQANLQIAEAAVSVSQSLRKLAFIQEASTPPLKINLPRAGTTGMQGVASIDWSGPIGLLVKQIAHTTHYKLRVIGKHPAVPIIISINSKNTPMDIILRDADYQAGKSANIVVYESSRVVELRYASS